MRLTNKHNLNYFFYIQPEEGLFYVYAIIYRLTHEKKKERKKEKKKEVCFEHMTFF